jgi:hypothetical protein
LSSVMKSIFQKKTSMERRLLLLSLEKSRSTKDSGGNLTNSSSNWKEFNLSVHAILQLILEDKFFQKDSWDTSHWFSSTSQVQNLSSKFTELSTRPCYQGSQLWKTLLIHLQSRWLSSIILHRTILHLICSLITSTLLENWQDGSMPFLRLSQLLKMQKIS